MNSSIFGQIKLQAGTSLQDVPALLYPFPQHDITPQFYRRADWHPFAAADIDRIPFKIVRLRLASQAFEGKII
jgi:hypothetical protein